MNNPAAATAASKTATLRKLPLNKPSAPLDATKTPTITPRPVKVSSFISFSFFVLPSDRALSASITLFANHPPISRRKKLPNLPKVNDALLAIFCAGAIAAASIFFSITLSLPSRNCCCANLASCACSCCSFCLSNA